MMRLCLASLALLAACGSQAFGDAPSGAVERESAGLAGAARAGARPPERVADRPGGRASADLRAAGARTCIRVAHHRPSLAPDRRSHARALQPASGRRVIGRSGAACARLAWSGAGWVLHRERCSAGLRPGVRAALRELVQSGRRWRLPIRLWRRASRRSVLSAQRDLRDRTEPARIPVALSCAACAPAARLRAVQSAARLRMSAGARAEHLCGPGERRRAAGGSRRPLEFAPGRTVGARPPRAPARRQSDGAGQRRRPKHALHLTPALGDPRDP